MTVFVDTSALYALLSTDDPRHQDSVRIWETLANKREILITTNYVLVETIALVQNRLGLQAVNDVVSRLEPLMEVMWVDRDLDRRGRARLFGAAARDVSLVDCISFEAMRDRSLDLAFAFDDHFVRQGFRTP